MHGNTKENKENNESPPLSLQPPCICLNFVYGATAKQCRRLLISLPAKGKKEKSNKHLVCSLVSTNDLDLEA